MGRAPKGCKDVQFYGIGDKRQYTVILEYSANRRLILPVELIWEGVEGLTGAQPKKHIHDQHRKYIHHSQSSTHWVTLNILIDYIRRIRNGYIKDTKFTLGLKDDHNLVLFLDCFSTHIKRDLIDKCTELYPEMILIFVPPQFTAEIQPLDVSTMGPFKKRIQRSAGRWQVQKYVRFIEKHPGEEFCLKTQLKKIKNDFFQWILDAAKWLQYQQPTLYNG